MQTFCANKPFIKGSNVTPLFCVSLFVSTPAPHSPDFCSSLHHHHPPTSCSLSEPFSYFLKYAVLFASYACPLSPTPSLSLSPSPSASFSLPLLSDWPKSWAVLELLCSGPDKLSAAVLSQCSDCVHEIEMEGGRKWEWRGGEHEGDRGLLERWQNISGWGHSLRNVPDKVIRK